VGGRFSNLLGAYELAVRLRGENFGHDDPDVDWALVTFGMKLGRAAARRATDDGAILIEASAHAAERICDSATHVEMLLLLGKFWLERGQLDRGMEAYRRCVDAAQAAENLSGVALASTALAFVMRDPRRTRRRDLAIPHGLHGRNAGQSAHAATRHRQLRCAVAPQARASDRCAELAGGSGGNRIRDGCLRR
jgi:hypothetical protein